jgi:putative hemolysin
MDTLLGIVAIFALVFMNAFFVAAEFAFVGSRRTRLAQLAAEGNPGAIAAEDAIKHLDSYIAATQLGITLASLGLGWIGEPAVAHLLEPVFRLFMTEETITRVGHPLSVVIGFSIVTMLHIVLGELAPKTIALQRPESTSVLVARPTRLFLRVFRPVIYVMNGIGNAVVRLLGFEPAAGHTQVHSAEELEMLVHSSREAGLLQESEEILLRRVFDFSDIEVQEIMQPRVEVDAIDIDTALPDLLTEIATQHYSRYPVYEETIDHVVGILHTKDLLDTIAQRPELLTTQGDGFQLASVLRPPIYVPVTVGVDKVLEQMRRTKTHIVIVIDEYGGMAGLATMEDIIEELVGEVQDEFDFETSPISGGKDVAVVDGLVSMTDVIERFGDPGLESLSTTVGGYVAERLERIPVVGDQIPFADYDLRVEEMDGMRVSKVRFIRRKEAKAEPGGVERDHKG